MRFRTNKEVQQSNTCASLYCCHVRNFMNNKHHISVNGDAGGTLYETMVTTKRQLL